MYAFFNEDCSYTLRHLVHSIALHIVICIHSLMYSLFPRFLHECLLSMVIANIGLRVYLKHKRIPDSYNINLSMYAQNQGEK